MGEHTPLALKDFRPGVASSSYVGDGEVASALWAAEMPKLV